LKKQRCRKKIDGAEIKRLQNNLQEGFTKGGLGGRGERRDKGENKRLLTRANQCTGEGGEVHLHQKEKKASYQVRGLEPEQNPGRNITGNFEVGWEGRTGGGY